jgi:hypothetical protein|tara:strand:+ start:6905 stop:7135 length:231 start_codon:yes stop_codon:yes gene_type:complete
MTDKSIINISDFIAVDVELLRSQRDTLLETIDAIEGSKPDMVDNLFGLDRDDVIEKLVGVINLLDGLLDEAEGFTV